MLGIALDQLAITYSKIKIEKMAKKERQTEESIFLDMRNIVYVSFPENTYKEIFKQITTGAHRTYIRWYCMSRK